MIHADVGESRTTILVPRIIRIISFLKPLVKDQISPPWIFRAGESGARERLKLGTRIRV